MSLEIMSLGMSPSPSCLKCLGHIQDLPGNRSLRPPSPDLLLNPSHRPAGGDGGTAGACAPNLGRLQKAAKGQRKLPERRRVLEEPLAGPLAPHPRLTPSCVERLRQAARADQSPCNSLFDEQRPINSLIIILCLIKPPPSPSMGVTQISP